MKTQDKILRALKKEPVQVKFLNGHSIKKALQDINISIDGTMTYLTFVSESRIVDNIKGEFKQVNALIIYDSKSRCSGSVYRDLNHANIIVDSQEINDCLIQLSKLSLHTSEEIEIAKQEIIQSMQHFHENFS
tara:strand:- start:3604 stop:4002 length:399 start_codon:yes stop_codon:yes gene_type:complete